MFRQGAALQSPGATSLAAVSSTSLGRKLTPKVSSSGRPTSPSDGVEVTETQKHAEQASVAENEPFNGCGLLAHTQKTMHSELSSPRLCDLLWQHAQ